MMRSSIEVVEITDEAGIVKARVRARALAEALGFNYMDQTRISTSISELAGTLSNTQVEAEQRSDL